LIGAVNSIASFDQAYGRNGGEYRSTYFLSNKSDIVIFDPSGKKVFKGNRKEVDLWAAQNQHEKFTSKKRLIILTEQGVIDVETNIIIFIDQINKIPKGTFADYQMILVPSIFDVVVNEIGASKKAIEYLGPFAKTNKPNFANIKVGNPITDELWDKWDGDAAADMFTEWKKSVEAGDVDTESSEKPAQTTPTATTQEFDKDGFPISNEAYKDSDLSETESDDLPY
jgi:hypothetical protein